MQNHPFSKSLTFKYCLLWTPLLVWYLIGFFFSHSDLFFNQVDVFYYQAGKHWLHQQPLYDGQGNMFVYFPTSAVLFAPLSLLSLHFFELSYRLLSILVITAGVFSFVRDTANSHVARVFFWSLIATIVLSQAALFVGQLHMMTTGLMLLGFSAIAREKWWTAAIWLTLALALKPTSLILFLLALALFPKISVRLICCTLLTFLLSLILQSPHYVINQYSGFINSFHVAMQHDGKNPQQWATLFGAIAFYTNHFIDGFSQFSIRIIAGISVYVLCLRAKIMHDQKTAIYFIVLLGMCYLMLFNSRTENNDYVMVAPLMGYALAVAIAQKKRLISVGVSMGIILIAINWNLCKLITPGHNVWLNPTIITLFLVLMAYPLLSHRTTPKIIYA